MDILKFKAEEIVPIGDCRLSLLEQIMSIWVNPEIEKRKSNKRLPEDFKLRGAQIIFSLQRNFHRVRLNGEIKAIADCGVNQAIKLGDNVPEAVISGVKSIDLTDCDPNCAHITLILINNELYIGFDFRYNKKLITENIDAAKEFYKSAVINLKENLLRPFYDNLFSASELCAVSILSFLPDKEILENTISFPYRS